MKPISVASIRLLDLAWLLLLIPAVVPVIKSWDITVACVLLLAIPNTMFGCLMYLRRQQTGLAVRLLEEAHSLMPAWLVTVAAPCVPILFLDYESGQLFSVFLFVIGCAFLGASAFGNEYNHRTMGLLLAQPIARERLWLEKMLVLGVGLLSALFVMELVVFSSERADWSVAWFFVIPPLCALCAGPLLTFLTRNTLAAAVFTIGIPLTVLLGSMTLPWFCRELLGVAADEDRLVARFLLFIALPIYCLGGSLLS